MKLCYLVLIIKENFPNLHIPKRSKFLLFAFILEKVCSCWSGVYYFFCVNILHLMCTSFFSTYEGSFVSDCMKAAMV